MAKQDLILIHAPSVYDFRKEFLFYGPVSDLVPSTPVFEMYPFGFMTLAAHLHKLGYKVRIVNLASMMLNDPKLDVPEFLRGWMLESSGSTCISSHAPGHWLWRRSSSASSRF
jgi:hypothetical protein